METAISIVSPQCTVPRKVFFLNFFLLMSVFWIGLVFIYHSLKGSLANSRYHPKVLPFSEFSDTCPLGVTKRKTMPICLLFYIRWLFQVSDSYCVYFCFLIIITLALSTCMQWPSFLNHSTLITNKASDGMRQTTRRPSFHPI